MVKGFREQLDSDDEQNQQDNQHLLDEHFTQRENNLNTLRQNFKCVQHTPTSLFLSLLFNYLFI